MSALRARVAAMLLACGLIAAHADQRAPELDGLFVELAAVSDPHVAAGIEAKIWPLWLASGDAGIDAMMGAGIDAMESGRLDRAVELFTRVIESMPDFAEGWNKRATAYYLRSEPTRSVLDIERTLALEPRHFGAVSGMGLILLGRGDLIGALGAFERVLQIYPASLSAQLHVRRIRARLRGRSA